MIAWLIISPTIIPITHEKTTLILIWVDGHIATDVSVNIDA